MSTCHAPACLEASGKSTEKAPDFPRREWVKFAAIRLPGAEPDLRVVTPRQLQIWRLIAEGQCTKEIAAELGLSVKTLDCHRANLLKRTGARGTADLTRAAVALGVIHVPIIGGGVW